MASVKEEYWLEISGVLRCSPSSFGTILDGKPSSCELELYVSQACLPTMP